MQVARVCGVLFLLSLFVGTACENVAEREFRDYLSSTYYTTLAKARGDIISEWVALAKTVDYEQLPATNDKYNEMFLLLERWFDVSSHFDKSTEKDDADPRLKPMRDKYRAADGVFTYMLTEYWSGLDSRAPLNTREQHLAGTRSSYLQASRLLNEAYEMLRRLMRL